MFPRMFSSPARKIAASTPYPLFSRPKRGSVRIPHGIIPIRIIYNSACFFVFPVSVSFVNPLRVFKYRSWEVATRRLFTARWFFTARLRLFIARLRLFSRLRLFTWWRLFSRWRLFTRGTFAISRWLIQAPLSLHLENRSWVTAW